MMNYLHRLREPKSYPVQAPELAPDVLATWLRYSPAAQPEDRDWEDWAENAVMLHALDKISGGSVIILEANNTCSVSGELTSRVPPNPSAPDAFMYGIWQASDSWQFPANFNMIGNCDEIVRAIQHYPTSLVFQRAAKRNFVIVDADRDQIEAALLEFHNAGHRELFVKTRFKEAAIRFSLPEEPVNLWRSIQKHEAFEWFLVSYEGAKDCLFIQEIFEPTNEYRTIIVGDKAVTGAGCVEAFTPLYNMGSAFDDRMELVRNRSEPLPNPEVAKRFQAFAETFAAEWAAEQGDHMIYSLDLAIDGNTGDVVAIEMNQMQNLGLYATNADLLVQAIHARFA